MRIKFSAIYLALLTFTIGIERDIYQEIRVFDPQPATLRTMHDLGIPLDHVRFVKNQYIDLVARDDQVEALLGRGISLAVLIEDMGRRAVKRSIPAVSRVFPLGSMLGNYTFSEAVARMDSLAARYPQFVAPRQSIGKSIEGRDIWAFKVSDNPGRDEDEPEVLFTGLTHAREPLGMMNLFYYVQTLCENYGTDAEATSITGKCGLSPF
ncbi:MAG: zinc carboxypeptidase [FCB group bacterium]|nr:zinc carboxypeptidase [FCB group bacterium]